MKTKRIFALITVILIIATNMYLVACNDTLPASTAGLTFSKNPDGNSYTLTGIGSCSSNEIIVSTYKNKPVTSIDKFAFYMCEKIKKVTLCNTITTIGELAFSFCSNLNSVILSDGVTTIDSYAFADCYKLENVNIPNGVKHIGDYAFSNCPNLEKITIPSSVTSIGDAPFSYCDKLQSIEVSIENANYCSVDGNLYNKNKTKLIQHVCGNQNTTFSLPNTVSTIGKHAFYGCHKLNNFIVPNNVTYIGEGAFYFCQNFNTIVIHNNVTFIGKDAFYGCSKLTIRCASSSKPKGWDNSWNSSNCSVEWGYTK